MENFLDYIVKSKINKRSSVQISIPTCNSYGITKQTIARLYKQRGIKFDVLIIDNGNRDYKRLAFDYPKINYVVLKQNTGNSGAQRIGMEIAIKKRYKYIVCSDNDAFLLSDQGLSKLYKRLKSNQNIDCVAANHCDNLINTDIVCRKQLPFHFLFIKCSFLRKIELHNFYIFLVTEDIAFTSKIISNGKLLLCHDILYYHDAFKPKFLQNFTIYFGVRGFLIILFLEKNISLKLRLYHFLHMFYYPTVALFHSLILKDFSYIKTVFIAIFDFISNYKKINLSSIPINKYVFIESKKKLNHAVSMTTLNSIILKKEYYWYSNYLKKRQYYYLKKNI